MIWEQGAQWVSRTLAVVLVMILPGVIGNWIDGRFGTSVFMPLGFGLGVITGIVVLIVLGKQFTPPARGAPIPWDDEPDQDAAENRNGTAKDGEAKREP